MTASNNFQILTLIQARSRQLAIGLFLLALAGPLTLGWLTLAGCSRFSDYGGTAVFVSVSSGLAFSIVGGLIFLYRHLNYG